MNARHVRFSQLLLLACSCFVACAGQAPIERREPPAVALGNREWPTGKTVHRGTRLLVFPFDPAQPPSECRVREIAVDRLICDGGRGAGSVDYARSAIATLQKKPRASFGGKLVKAGALLTSVGAACGLSGEATCAVGAAGLALMTAGIVALIVETVARVHALFAPPLYEAPSRPQTWQAEPL